LCLAACKKDSPASELARADSPDAAAPRQHQHPPPSAAVDAGPRVEPPGPDKPAGKPRHASWKDGRDREPQAYVPAADYEPAPGVPIKVGAYALDVDEVYLRLYRECVKARACAPVKLDARLEQPVTNISFVEAEAYCRFRGRRLPTESEWIRTAFPPGRGHGGAGPPGLDRFSEMCESMVIGGVDGEECPPVKLQDPVPPWDIDRQSVPDGTFARALGLGQLDPTTLGDSILIDDVEIEHLFGNVAEFVVGPGGEPVIRGASFLRTRGVALRDREVVDKDARFEDVGFRCASDLR
jgi:hypothetical protein